MKIKFKLVKFLFMVLVFGLFLNLASIKAVEASTTYTWEICKGSHSAEYKMCTTNTLYAWAYNQTKKYWAPVPVQGIPETRDIPVRCFYNVKFVLPNDGNTYRVIIIVTRGESTHYNMTARTDVYDNVITTPNGGEPSLPGETPLTDILNSANIEPIA